MAQLRPERLTAKRIPAQVQRKLSACAITSLVMLSEWGCTVDYRLERSGTTSSELTLSLVCGRIERSAARTINADSDTGPALDNADLDTLRSTRDDFYEHYCDDAEVEGFGWGGCLIHHAVLGIRTTPRECDEEVPPYLECLFDEERANVDECDPYLVSERCAPAGASDALIAASHCGGGLTSLEGTGSSASETGLAYGRVLIDCPDGESYGFLCQPPDGACAAACECRGPAEPNSEVFLEQITDESFEQAVWEACAFPDFADADVDPGSLGG